MALTHATYDVTPTNQGTHYAQNESRFKKKNVAMDPMYAEG